ncbi:MAG: DNA primase [bacterium]
MKHLPKETIDQVVQGFDIVEVISEFVSLTKAGERLKGLCPFHSEKTPSFTVSPQKQLFYCFGCGAGGDIITFLMKFENCSFVEAVEFLAQRKGIQLPDENGMVPQDHKRKEKEAIMQVNELAARYYHDLLMKSATGKSAQRYLESRRVNHETVTEFCLGWSSDSGKNLLHFLRKKNISLKEAQDAGLASLRQGQHQGQHQGQDEGYDRFRGRIIFPIYNQDGRIIALGGRKIADESFGPKYLNSSETLVYSKSNSLYGLYQARQFIRTSGYAIVVEGYMDFLSLYQAGIKNAIATLGTSLTLGQVKLLERYTKKAVFIYDGDQAGISAMLRGLDIFEKQGVDVRIVMLPGGHDPDSFIRQYGPLELNKRIDQGTPAVEFLINQAIQRNGISTVEGKVRATREILAILSKVFDTLVRMEYVQQVAKLLDIREEIILDELHHKVQESRQPMPGIRQRAQGAPMPKGVQGKKESVSVLDATQVAERMLLGLICRGDVPMEDVIEKSILDNDFQSEPMKQIAKEVFSLWRERGRIRPEELIFALKDEKLKGVISGFLFEEVDHGDISKEFHDCVAKIKSRDLIKKLQYLHDEIKSKPHNDPQINVLLKEYSEIKKKIMIS